jgi:hypothetical protein
MSNVAQLEARETDTADGPEQQANGPDASYHVVPYTERPGGEDLFAYRAAMAEPVRAAETEPEETKPKRRFALLPTILILAFGALFLLVLPKLMKPKPPALYMDMGTRRFDPAGLSGRLIVRWEGSAGYQLYLDPLDQQHVAEFQAVVQDPPHPLSVVIRLRDSAGIVACQKELDFPAIAPLPGSPYHAQALAPRQTPVGDTVQNMAGADGQIAEITVSGGLPCPLKAYQRFAGWDFFTNFPTVDGQADWLRYENGLAGGKRPNFARGRGAPLQVQRLPAPIEGDDVIVGDNPSRGTVDTGGGRVFWVGASGMRNRAPEWQVFPAAIHFRCDKNGACALTRANSRTTLQARLMK